MVGCPSSLTIVPAPWLSLIVALTGFERLTKNVLLGSNLVSPLTVTATGWLVAVGRGGGAVGRGKVDRDGLEAGARQAHREGEHRRPRIALVLTDVADRNGRLPVV